MRLTDRLLGAVGTLWIVDTRPLDNGGVACKVLKLLAGRTAAELASQKAVDWLHECIESGGSMTEIARKIGAPTK